MLLAVQVRTEGNDVAFVNVNVIPMDSERVLHGQTVLTSAGRVKAIGAVSEIKVPQGVRRVNGTGKYLMPGLADMHGHLTHRGPAMSCRFVQLLLDRFAGGTNVPAGSSNSRGRDGCVRL